MVKVFYVKGHNLPVTLRLVSSVTIRLSSSNSPPKLTSPVKYSVPKV